MRSVLRTAVLFSSLSTAAAGTAEAGPAMWGMAINESTRDCAGYWQGDEFTEYELPPGWTSHYPARDDAGQNIDCRSDAGATYGSRLVTPLGSCCFAQGQEEACCRQMGLKFVSSNIGTPSKRPVPDFRADAASSAGGGDSGCSCTSSGRATGAGLLLALVLAGVLVFRSRGRA